uniref:Uncharacterized protein n=1 Tax=Pelusios castaneus TaxID=367368 RepID=A0A8C8S1X8_9SAUR
SPIYLLCQSNYNKCFLCGPFFCRLEKCGLIVACHKDLSSVLHINQTLKELDLSYNDLGSPGVEDLCKGLKHPKCELQTLRLWACELTADCCGVLSSVLSTRKSLAEVNLNLNELGDSGLRWLCTGLKHPDCKLQKLHLLYSSVVTASPNVFVSNSCGLTDNCGVLSSVLSTSQTLIELSLNLNKLGDSGVKQLCTGLKHPNCKLQKLGLFRCDLTADCCGDLSSALGVNQFLTELDLKWNRQLGDSGVKILCEKLKHPNCRLKKIRLSWCNITADCCGDLTTVLSTNQTLTELDLGENNLGYPGVKLLCEKLKDQNCKKTIIENVEMAEKLNDFFVLVFTKKVGGDWTQDVGEGSKNGIGSEVKIGKEQVKNYLD